MFSHLVRKSVGPRTSESESDPRWDPKEQPSLVYDGFGNPTQVPVPRVSSVSLHKQLKQLEGTCTRKDPRIKDSTHKEMGKAR